MNKLLKKLTEAPGISGFENEVRRLIRDLIAEHVDQWRTDALGNLIALKKGTGESELNLLLDAHMDEVGLMVTSADSLGALKFKPVGGVNSAAIVGKMVRVGSNGLTGVIGAKPVHLLKDEQRRSKNRIDTLRIDIGAKSKEEAARKAKPGTPAVFISEYEEYGEVAVGKAFDDRAGCAVLITLLQRNPFPFDLTAVFSVQEEVGLRGAGVAAFGVKPDAAIVLESTPAYDLPTERDESPNVVLGRGPAIYVMDRGTIQDPRLVSFLMKTADANGIPFQIRRPGGGGTNTAVIQRSGPGIPAATVSVPARYIHGPVSMINLDDFEKTIDLVETALRSFDEELIKPKG